MANHIRDLTGQSFGFLVAMSVRGTDKNGRKLWSCTCTCGETLVVRSSELVKGRKKSCGCKRSELVSMARRAFSKTTTSDQAIQSRIEKVASGCWEWTGRRDADGYGIAWVGGKKSVASRLAYETYVAPIPVGMAVCHKCDNPPCVNPDHLFVGTTADNIHDSVRKGRFSRGEKIYTAKLTEADVRDIRNSPGNLAELASKYGVHQNTIRRVINGRAWRHV